MKKYSVVLLLISLLLINFNQVFAQRFKSGGFYFNLIKDNNGDRKALLVSQNETYPKWNDEDKPTGDVVIPSVANFSTLPFDVIGIDIEAFHKCTALRSVQISDKLKFIKHSAFKGCFSLHTITVDKNNPSLSSKDGVLFDKKTNELLIYPIGKKDKVYNIPDFVKSVGLKAFEGSKFITEVHVSNSVTKFSKEAFYECKALEKITIPANVVEIDTNAFFGCVGLKNVEFNEGLSKFGSGAFKHCVNLRSVKIPSTVAEIESYAFAECTNLNEVQIAEGVKTIGAKAFSKCKNLKIINIPSTVTKIGEYLCWQSNSNCKYVFSQIANPSTVTVGDRAFNDIAGNCTLVVPNDSKGLYEADAKWSCFNKIIEEKDFVKVQGITLNSENAEVQLNQKITLVATLNPKSPTNNTIMWESDNEFVATVSDKGVVEALDYGTANISVITEEGHFKATCKITVVEPIAVESVSLKKSNLTIDKGETFQLEYTILPQNAANKKVKWDTDDSDIATVSDNGLVTAIDYGTAEITVTTEDGAKTAVCNILIPVPVKSVTLNCTDTAISQSEKVQLLADVKPDNAYNKDVKWSSSDDNIATVSQSGLVSPVANGNITITATTVSGSKTATCNIKIGNGTGINGDDINAISIYPTIVEDGFIVTTTKGKGLLHIYNVTGTIIRTVNITNNKQYVDVSSLQAGVYMAKINNKVIRFVKR